MESHLSLILQAKSSYDTRSDIGNFGSSLVTFSYNINSGAWLLVSTATYHMTFVAIDFTTTSPPRRTNVANANGVASFITGVGSVHLSSSLKLLNMLLVPSLSYKLLFVSQFTIELNCSVLIYSTFYFL